MDQGLKRYDVRCVNSVGTTAEAHSSGQWVRWTDVKALVASTEAIRKALEAARGFIDVALQVGIVPKSSGKGGHDGNGNAWTECAGTPEWRVRQIKEAIDAALVARAAVQGAEGKDGGH